MKRVLVYGDSNTWGADQNDKRYPDEQQWPVILQVKLGEKYKIIQEGLSGRVAGDFDDGKSYHNGQKHFEPIYRSTSPVDIVVMALGTNDVDDGLYDRQHDQIVSDILWYENESKKFLDEDETEPAFVYILPPPFSGLYYDRGRPLVFNKEKREVVNTELKKKVKNFVEISDIDLSKDGLHFSPIGHEQMAKAVFAKITELENQK